MRCEISISGSSPATSRDQGTLLEVGEEESESWVLHQVRQDVPHDVPGGHGVVTRFPTRSDRMSLTISLAAMALSPLDWPQNFMVF